jgi:hypothetical protein
MVKTVWQRRAKSICAAKKILHRGNLGVDIQVWKPPVQFRGASAREDYIASIAEDSLPLLMTQKARELVMLKDLRFCILWKSVFPRPGSASQFEEEISHFPLRQMKVPWWKEKRFR